MTLLFLMGTDLAGAFLVFLILTGFALGLFLVVSYLLKRVLRNSSEKLVFFIAMIAVWVLVPSTIVIAFWALSPNAPQVQAVDPLYEGQTDELEAVSDERTTLLDLEREAIEREFQNDTTFLSLIMDSTFIELDGSKLKNKHQVLKTISANNLSNKRAGISLDSFRLEEPMVHVYENTAVVTFIMHTFRKENGTPMERRTRFYDVWVRRGDEWKAVTWQASSL